MSLLRTTTKGLSEQAVVTILYGAVELFTFAIISRLLTKDEFGYYAIIQGIRGVLLFASEAGIGSSIIQRKDTSSQYINAAFTLSFSLGIVFSVLLFLSAKTLSSLLADSSLISYLQIIAFTLFVNSVGSVARSLLIKDLKFKTIGLINVFSHIVGYGFVGITLAYLGLGVWSMVWAVVSDSLLKNIVPYFYLSNTRFSFKYHEDDYKAILSFGGWLTLSRLFMSVYVQLDKLLLGKLFSVAELGRFSRPNEFIKTATTQIAGIYDTSLFPILSGMQDNAESIKRSFNHSLFYLNVIGSLLTTLFIFNAGLIIKIVLGNQWLNLQLLFQILSVGILFQFNSQLADCYYRSLGKVKLLFIYQIFSCASMALAIFIGSRWNIEIVAASIVICKVIIAFLKLTVLITGIKYSIRDLLRTLRRSFNLTAIIILEGLIIVLFLHRSIFVDCLLVVFQLLTIAHVILFYPRLIGKHFAENLYPLIKNIYQRK